MDGLADRNLLFGLLALQNGIIDQSALVVAFRSWTRDKGRSMAEILLEQKAIDEGDREAISVLAANHIKRHGGDPERSLAAVPSPTSLRDGLAALADPEIEATLDLTPSSPTGSEPSSEATGTYGARAGDGRRFRILRPHARGGLGEVFVALDDELHREVALKQILGHHADDQSSRNRFLIEAEITGGLEHPGIVPVYGLGRDVDGRPYYAMRFIRGDSLKDAIAAYHTDPSLKSDAGKKSLALRKLLRRFTDVCNAIEYAHARGVLHRDIKPGNVIVGKHGETLVVDWGLAKPMGHAEPAVLDGERTLMPSSASGSAETLPGQAIGTPAYMSPEQAAGDLELMGPRSDVYSLGASLYCLLTGRAPFEGTDLGALLRDVRKGVFPPPRQVDHSIDRALEAVCLKAMAVKPEDRHATARALADDVERWSADEPVSAWREPWSRRATRWLSRHRTGVSTAAAALLVGVVGLAIITVLLGQSKARVEIERNRAERERNRAEAVNKFLVNDLLGQANPEKNPVAVNVTVRELLDKAAKDLDSSVAMKQNPGVEGTIRSDIGSTYYYLGLYREALAQHERAVPLLQSAEEVPAAERILAMIRLDWLTYKLGQHEKAKQSCRDTINEATRLLGPDHEHTIYASNNLATMLVPHESAWRIFKKNIEIQKRVLGPDHRLTLSAEWAYASALTLYHAGDVPKNLEDGLKIFRSLRERSPKVMGPDDPKLTLQDIDLGFTLARSGRFAEARDILAPARERCRTVYGPDHLQFAMASQKLALAEEGLGHLEAAEALLLEALEIRRRKLLPDHSQTLETVAHLARVSMALRKVPEAASYCKELVRQNKDFKNPRSRMDRLKRGEPDLQRPGAVDALDGILAGRVDPVEFEDIVRLLFGQLEWLSWRNDWFRQHAMCLWGQAIPGAPSTSLLTEGERAFRLTILDTAIKDLESNPTVPPWILDEDRARSEKVLRSKPSQRK